MHGSLKLLLLILQKWVVCSHCKSIVSLCDFCQVEWNLRKPSCLVCSCGLEICEWLCSAFATWFCSWKWFGWGSLSIEISSNFSLWTESYTRFNAKLQITENDISTINVIFIANRWNLDRDIEGEIKADRNWDSEGNGATENEDDLSRESVVKQI